ncbi:uncharacterized protein DS421_7g211750 [Arachis hypogaea]|nr:uncharacterized protein DS421_7g211750 [Arachis hypogaea]
MYRSLCWASRYDCKDIDGPLMLLLVWAWIQMPTIWPLPLDTSFPLAHKLNDYQPTTEHYKNWTTSDVKRRLDNLPPDGRMQSQLGCISREHVDNYQPSDQYMDWYIGKFGYHLRLSECVEQEEEAQQEQPHQQEQQPQQEQSPQQQGPPRQK